MENSDLVRRVRSGHGLLIDGDPAFTFVEIAKVVDEVALGTTVNAESLHDDLNQLAARVAAAREAGDRPDVRESRQALLRIETAAEKLLEALGETRSDPALARVFDEESVQGVLRVHFEAKRAQGTSIDAGPAGQRQMVQWLITQLKSIFRNQFHVEPEEATVNGGKKASAPFIRFARFVLGRLGVDLSAKSIAT
ncbi:MAG: hypothetical protein R3286_15290 [Gammaproteobacteria bacterium]|nr:hypothetical protein [Gammaproteobacteria bacterium]